MLGAIIGDIVGSRFEFSKLRNNKSREFDFFHEDCHFTDDTILTIATADAIINNKDFAKTYKEWVRKYPDSKYSYGTNFHAWALDEDYNPYNSFGNGSAMRVSPIGFISNSLIESMDNAEKSAEVTHNHIEGLKGSASVSACIYLAKNKISKHIIKDIIEMFFGYNLSEKLDDIRKTYKFDETCQGSVPQSIICFLEGNSFEDCIRNAISLGGDTDTMGCIVGGIAEAYYGIPSDIKKIAMKYITPEMRKIVNDFYERIEKWTNDKLKKISKKKFVDIVTSVKSDDVLVFEYDMDKLNPHQISMIYEPLKDKLDNKIVFIPKNKILLKKYGHSQDIADYLESFIDDIVS